MTAISFNRWASLDEAITHYRASLDEKAGEVRRRFAREWLIDEEYMLAARQADEYAARSYADPVPEAVQSWADAAGMTAKSSAEDIRATRDSYNSALEYVRRTRLVAKESIRAATSARDMRSIHDQAWAELDAVTPA